MTVTPRPEKRTRDEYEAQARKWIGNLFGVCGTTVFNIAAKTTRAHVPDLVVGPLAPPWGSK